MTDYHQMGMFTNPIQDSSFIRKALEFIEPHFAVFLLGNQNILCPTKISQFLKVSLFNLACDIDSKNMVTSI